MIKNTLVRIGCRIAVFVQGKSAAVCLCLKKRLWTRKEGGIICYDKESQREHQRLKSIYVSCVFCAFHSPSLVLGVSEGRVAVAPLLCNPPPPTLTKNKSSRSYFEYYGYRNSPLPLRCMLLYDVFNVHKHLPGNGEYIKYGKNTSKRTFLKHFLLIIIPFRWLVTIY